MAEERLQKVLARAGIASRRAAESLITAGRVRVDGRIVKELGTRVPVRARIEVDGRVVVAEPLVYIVLHKPRGVVCTLKDPEGRPTVAEYLKDVGARVVPVGRLDFHTSGALICTNDGELASKLMHPRHHAQKEYVAKVSGVVDERTLERLRERIVIDGRATQPAEVRLLRVEDGKSWLSVKLGEGRNRQVRRLGEHAGVPVMRLVRVGHAGITAEDLRPGEWRRLTNDELRALKKEYGVPRRIHALDPFTEAPRGGRVTLRKPRAPEQRARGAGRKPNDEQRESPRRRTDDRAWNPGRGREDERAPRGPIREYGRPREQGYGRGDVRSRNDERPRGYGRGEVRPRRDETPRERGFARGEVRPGRNEGPRERGFARGEQRPPREERAGQRGYARGEARPRNDERPRVEARREHGRPHEFERSRGAGEPRRDVRNRSRR